MTFQSILFRTDQELVTGRKEIKMPAYFRDLNLDQVIDSLTKNKQEYDLKPFFYMTLQDYDSIQYRHKIMQDLEKKELQECINSFAEKMKLAKQYFISLDKLYYHYQKEGWFLEAIVIYCDAVRLLADDLARINLESQGFLTFRGYLSSHIQSDAFLLLTEEAHALKTALYAVKYQLRIKDDSIHVQAYEEASDYSHEVEELFSKFEQGDFTDFRAQLPSDASMNHIEAQILDYVANLYPDIFSKLDDFCEKNKACQDEKILKFDQEIQFYVAYLEYINKLKPLGLSFCYPHISTQSKEIYSYETFDLALAYKLYNEKAPIVCNDFYLSDNERVLVISGPNQGGKTTFARMVGQLHYLASIGCLVPGTKAKLFLFDKLFTHFEKEEDSKNLRGKLQDELIRIHDILQQATENSIIIMNEIFTSTTLTDAILLGKKIMEKILKLDSICICVTFIDELATLNEKTVSMVSTVAPDNPMIRTYKIVRKSDKSPAYAVSIAEKHGLTYHAIKERIKS